MALPPQLQMKAREIAKQRFRQEVLQKLMARRLGGAVQKPAAEPGEEDLGGYDALQEMLNKHGGGEPTGR